MHRPLHEIAQDIVRDPAFKGNAKVYAMPYIQAMLQMNSIAEPYFADTGDSVVRYGLSNLQSYRGETARKVKAELKAML